MFKYISPELLFKNNGISKASVMEKYDRKKELDDGIKN